MLHRPPTTKQSACPFTAGLALVAEGAGMEVVEVDMGLVEVVDVKFEPVVIGV